MVYTRADETLSLKLKYNFIRLGVMFMKFNFVFTIAGPQTNLTKSNWSSYFYDSLRSEKLFGSTIKSA
jgi:hypothetical protein